RKLTDTAPPTIQEAIDKGLGVEVDGMYYYIDPTKADEATAEARIAIDLQKLDKQYREDLEDAGDTGQSNLDKFKAEVQKIESEQGTEAAYQFIDANSTITFTSEFWEELSSGSSYLDRVAEQSHNLDNEDDEK